MLILKQLTLLSKLSQGDRRLMSASDYLEEAVGHRRVREALPSTNFFRLPFWFPRSWRLMKGLTKNRAPKGELVI